MCSKSQKKPSKKKKHLLYWGKFEKFHLQNVIFFCLFVSLLLTNIIQTKLSKLLKFIQTMKAKRNKNKYFVSMKLNKNARK